MDALVPCYSCRVKGRAATWQRLLLDDPFVTPPKQSVDAVPDLPPTRGGFDAERVWASYAEGRAHVAATPAEEVTPCDSM